MPPPKPQGAIKVSARPLPPLPKLRVRHPNKTETNPCVGIMTSVLGTCNSVPIDTIGYVVVLLGHMGPC